ncbi:T3SS effector HopA1 family protein [Streptomyces acidiscabies]|uniref:T3SS effector HopA1 family protein n=1 Tax=Streptomyces acidiscabies TaxID=42234 RepID=UPI00067E590F|nr:T3SS effector HopA1 family protein [Streptomyces acidiscabies]
MTGPLVTVTGVTDVDVPNLTARVAGTEIGARTLNELRARLADELYRTFHQGARPAAVHPRDLVDPALEAELKAAVPHPAVRVPTRLLSEDGEEATVVLAGVRVRVPRARVRTQDGAAVEGGVTVELPPYRPSLSPGFLSVVGSRLPRAQGGPVLRIYLHVPDAGAAPAVWGAVLRGLEDAGLPYRAKILSHPDRYPRRDAMVVYVTDEVERAVDTVARAPLDLAGPVSPFTRALAPGLSLAWDPAPRAGAARRPSFGQHRARACADGLVDHARYGIPVADAVARALRAAGADPVLPHRNLDSPCPAL